MSAPAYNSRRREAAMQRWRRIADMRRRNMTYAAIGDALGVSAVAVFKAAMKLAEYELDRGKP